MAPELHVRLQVSLSEITYYVTPKAEGAIATISPDDLDAAASIEALDRVRTIIQSLGGRYTVKRSTERGQREDADTQTNVDKLLAEFDDGVAGRAFVEQVWPAAEGWLRNKGTRRFRIKYGEDIVELGAMPDIERALGLMKDAVPAPKPKAAKAPKAKARAPKKPSKKVGPKKATAKSAKKGATKTPKKAAPKKTAKASRASKKTKKRR
ncbi:MAG TPA: hypothetical protein VIF09_06430 [Polyangiaceae bacterium]